MDRHKPIAGGLIDGVTFGFAPGRDDVAQRIESGRAYRGIVSVASARASRFVLLSLCTTSRRCRIAPQRPSLLSARLAAPGAPAARPLGKAKGTGEASSLAAAAAAPQRRPRETQPTKPYQAIATLIPRKVPPRCQLPPADRRSCPLQ